MKCVNCNKPYRFDRLKECPSCGETTPSNYQAVAERIIVESVKSDLKQPFFGKMQKTNNPLLRLLAVSFLIYLGSGVAGSTLTWVGVVTYNSVLLILGPILVILGFIIAFALCVSVIRQSY